MQQKRILQRWFQVSWYVLITFLKNFKIIHRPKREKNNWKKKKKERKEKPLAPIGPIAPGSFVVVLGLGVAHAALEPRHFHPGPAGPVECAPDGNDDTQRHAQVANHRAEEHFFDGAHRTRDVMRVQPDDAKRGPNEAG